MKKKKLILGSMVLLGLTYSSPVLADNSTEKTKEAAETTTTETQTEESSTVQFSAEETTASTEAAATDDDDTFFNKLAEDTSLSREFLKSEFKKAQAAGYTKEQFDFIMRIPTSDNSASGAMSVAEQALTNEQAKIVHTAKTQLGKPFQWGAKGPDSFDASGLVEYVYKKAVGMSLPAPTTSQERFGKDVSLTDIEPGDLLFYGTPGSTTFVSIYIGNNQSIDAPVPGKNVSIRNNVLTTSEFKPSFAKRVLKEGNTSSNNYSYTSANMLVTLSSKDLTLYNDINLKTKRSTGDASATYRVTGIYTFDNGNKVYSLYDSVTNSWYGYVSASNAVELSSGQYSGVNKNIKLKNNQLDLYTDNTLQHKRGTANADKVYQATGMYTFSNGLRVYSLYDNGNWVGYANVNAVNDYSSQTYTGIDKIVKFSSADNLTLYTDNYLTAKRSNAKAGKTYKATGMYTFASGVRVYSLYDMNSGAWYGYVNANDVDELGTGQYSSVNKTVFLLPDHLTLYNDNYLQSKRGTGDAKAAYRVNGMYTFNSDRHVYSLYDPATNGWVGYVDAKSVEEYGNRKYSSVDDVVSLSSDANLDLYNDVYLKYKRSTSNVNTTYRVSGLYTFDNGKKVYSLYDMTNVNWCGYIDVNNVTSLGNGRYNSLAKEITLEADHLTLFNDIYLQYKRSNGKTDTAYKLYGSYTFNNGKVVYSLYDKNDGWCGYIDSQFIK
ncbi:C40 family peptidase [Vagococcus vulneris]|uniref:NlpC/P60 domain-containing protein n=1 Tax=Vagococcus vulneris TaxID=1977869 RepID=A0A429ZSP8_9ENTE|nr:C40 family peptidase [Vagococcus vulneris]RST96747.1 hypothetical protein CBF37_10615 [Vagococcus vulneris]